MKTHQKQGLLLLLAGIIAISQPAIGCMNVEECLDQCGTNTKKYCCPQGTGTRKTCPYGWELTTSYPTSAKICTRSDSYEYSDSVGYKKDTYGSCAPTQKTYTCFVPSDASTSGTLLCAVCLQEPGDI